jgi:hypothetical protein
MTTADPNSGVECGTLKSLIYTCLFLRTVTLKAWPGEFRDPFRDVYVVKTIFLVILKHYTTFCFHSLTKVHVNFLLCI